MHILLTGGLGWTAQAIAQRLAASHRLLALDLPRVEPSAENRSHFEHIYSGSVTDFPTVFHAAQQADAILHLAVATGDVYQTADIPFAVNVKGTYNVFEAAHRLQIPKVILISSAPVHLIPLPKSVIGPDDWQSSPEGDHLYDLTKRLQEEIGRDYAQTFGLQVITLRAGHIVDGRTHLDPHGRPLDSLTYCRGGWVCRYDLAEACFQALHLTQPGFHTYHVIGARQARALFDIERTEKELGFVFQTHFEQY